MVQFKAMNLQPILASLKQERSRIESAIKALEALNVAPTATTATNTGKRKTMSAAARKRISLAQKARWAKVKKNG